MAGWDYRQTGKGRWMIRTNWEDQESVGFNCPSCHKELMANCGEITECSCGNKYKLKWDVEVIEVTPSQV